MLLPARTFGSSQHPDTPPLVCLHGFLGTSGDWADLAARLPHRRVVALDLPGHGDATDLPDAAYAFDAAVQAVADTIGALGGARCDLVGYSMGGRVALAVALAHPNIIHTLTVESASPGLPSETDRAERRALDADRASALLADLPGFLRDWYALPLFATLSASQCVDMIGERARGDAQELACGLVGMGTGAMPDLWPRLHTLTRPVRLVVGARDAKFVRVARQMAARLPDAAVHVVEGAGHNVHVERPEAFAALLREPGA